MAVSMDLGIVALWQRVGKRTAERSARRNFADGTISVLVELFLPAIGRIDGNRRCWTGT